LLLALSPFVPGASPLLAHQHRRAAHYSTYSTAVPFSRLTPRVVLHFAARRGGSGLWLGRFPSQTAPFARIPRRGSGNTRARRQGLRDGWAGTQERDRNGRQRAPSQGSQPVGEPFLSFLRPPRPVKSLPYFSYFTQIIRVNTNCVTSAELCVSSYIRDNKSMLMGVFPVTTA